MYAIPETSRTIKEMPMRLRPREEMDRLGAEHVADAVLLAVLLRSGTRGMNVMRLASDLLEAHGSLTALAAVGMDELCETTHGLGRVKARELKAALEIGRRLFEERIPDGAQVRTPEDAVSLLKARAHAMEREVFWVLRLDTKNRLKGRPDDVTRGLLDASLVHPREVFREAIRTASAAVILAHNHPSGDPTPSAEDIRITRQLVEAGRVVDIRVLDHVVIGREAPGREKDFVSMREDGIVSFHGA